MPSKTKRLAAFALALTVLCVSMAGCRKSDSGAVKTNALGTRPEMYDAEYWIDRGKDMERVLLSAAEITQVNAQTAISVDDFYDLVAYPSELSSAELNKYIAQYALPDFNLYGADGGMIYEAPTPSGEDEEAETPPETEGESDNYIDRLNENLNTAAIQTANKVSYALTLQNTSIRRFPSSDRAFASAEDRSEDLFLESPLLVGEPVIVLHTSADQTWYYIQTRNCRGWAYWSDLVFLEKSAWVAYIESTDFIVVTESSITVTPATVSDSRITLFMGTVLPIYPDYQNNINGRSTEGCYVVKFPAKDRFGNLEFKPVLIPMSSGVSRGFQPYTYENVLKAAFELAGEKLSVRGLSYGWDENRFFMTIYRTFGIYLPYTLTGQRAMPGRDTNLTEASPRERNNYFAKLSPGTLLYSNNAAFIYLGEDDGSHYIIHPASTFFIGETRYTANSIIITPMSIVREDGVVYYDSVVVGREFGIVK